MDAMVIFGIIITTMLAIIGYLFKDSADATKKSIEEVKNTNVILADDLKSTNSDIAKQFKSNAKEHRDLMLSLAKLDSKLPMIEDCEEDLEKLKSSDIKQWAKIDEHDEKLKKLVA